MTTTHRYNAEWEHLDTSVRLAWPEPEFAGCRRVSDVLVRVRAEPDAVLTALLRRAQGGDRLAGRVVVQALLGKLVLMSRRDRSSGLDEYCAELWCVLMRYPLARRGSVAGGLALDTLKAVVAARAPAEVALVVPPPVAAPEPDASAVIRSAAELGIIDASSARLLREIYVAGLTSAQAAASRNITPAAVRHRCRTVLRQLADQRELLAA